MPYVILLLFNMETISGFVGLSNILDSELKARKPMAVAALDLAVVLLGRVTLQIMRMNRCWRLRHYGFSIEVWELDVING